MSKTYIDDKFRREVTRHIIGNVAVRNSRSSLILGIFGPAGEGKTFQLDAVCSELNVHTRVIGPAELESENAGYPGELLRSAYLSLGRDSAPTSAIIINDIDTVLGDWGSMVQYTVNRQVVLDQLMAFCDFPESVSNRQVQRVPIIVTGNNPSALYGPLSRFGRMRAFEWNPDLSYKTSVVSSVFTGISREEALNLADRYMPKPTSFWREVEALLWNQWIEEVVIQDENGALDLISRNSTVDGKGFNPGYSEIVHAARLTSASEIVSNNYLPEISGGR